MLRPGYCSQSPKEMGHIPETHSLNLPILPVCWSPCCWSKYITFSCPLEHAWLSAPLRSTLGCCPWCSVFSLPFLVLSLGYFWCSLWELPGHRFLGQCSCWCQRTIVDCVSSVQTKQSMTMRPAFLYAEFGTETLKRTWNTSSISIWSYFEIYLEVTGTYET